MISIKGLRLHKTNYNKHRIVFFILKSKTINTPNKLSLSMGLLE